MTGPAAVPAVTIAADVRDEIRELREEFDVGTEAEGGVPEPMAES